MAIMLKIRRKNLELLVMGLSDLMLFRFLICPGTQFLNLPYSSVQQILIR